MDYVFCTDSCKNNCFMCACYLIRSSKRWGLAANRGIRESWIILPGGNSSGIGYGICAAFKWTGTLDWIGSGSSSAMLLVFSFHMLHRLGQTGFYRHAFSFLFRRFFRI